MMLRQTQYYLRSSRGHGIMYICFFNTYGIEVAQIYVTGYICLRKLEIIRTSKRLL